jgi:hypothetical protein
LEKKARKSGKKEHFWDQKQWVHCAKNNRDRAQHLRRKVKKKWGKRRILDQKRWWTVLVVECVVASWILSRNQATDTHSQLHSLKKNELTP